MLQNGKDAWELIKFFWEGKKEMPAGKTPAGTLEKERNEKTRR
jgi:hypothetical protein